MGIENIERSLFVCVELTREDQEMFISIYGIFKDILLMFTILVQKTTGPAKSFNHHRELFSNSTELAARLQYILVCEKLPNFASIMPLLFATGIL